MAEDTGVEYGPTRKDMEEGRRRERVQKLADEIKHKKDTEDSIAKYESKLKNAEDQNRQKKELWSKTIHGTDKGGKPKKVEPLSHRIGKAALGAVDAVGPNPFGQSRREYSHRPQIQSGFSSGGFPSMSSGFGGSLSPPSFPRMGVGKPGAGIGSGLGFGSLNVGFPKLGGSAPAPKKHRRRKPAKRRRRR